MNKTVLKVSHRIGQALYGLYCRYYWRWKCSAIEYMSIHRIITESESQTKAYALGIEIYGRKWIDMRRIYFSIQEIL